MFAQARFWQSSPSPSKTIQATNAPHLYHVVHLPPSAITRSPFQFDATRGDLLQEAWDLPVYWQIAYPVMVAGSFLLGILGPAHPVRWGLLVGLGQGVWSLVVTALQKGVPNLLPLGLIMFAILSLPCIAAAWIGGWLGRRIGS